MISVSALAFGYLLMNIFSSSPNISGDNSGGDICFVLQQDICDPLGTELVAHSGRSGVMLFTPAIIVDPL